MKTVDKYSQDTSRNKNINYNDRFGSRKQWKENHKTSQTFYGKLICI